MPASVTVFMFAGAAEANTSAGAPWLICVASAELPAKLNLTVAPGLAASKSLPIRVNDSVSDAAANTLTVPVTPALLLPGDDLAACWPPPQPARASTAKAATAGSQRVLIRTSFLCCRRPERSAPPRPWST